MRLARLLPLVVGLVAVTAALAGCGGDDDERSNKVFVAPPWSESETLTYDLEQKGVDNEAECTLKTETSGGETTLTRSCSDNRGYRDEGVVVALSGSLEPRTSRRTTYHAEDKKETVYSVEYRGDEAYFEVRSEGKSRDTTRDLPGSTAESPNPGWYDDESILWLVRGIKLESGYEDGYTHVINAGQPRVLGVEIAVRSQETVRVPAGEFRAWEVRVSRESSVYTYWVDEGPGHRVVKAKIEDSTYELTKAE